MYFTISPNPIMVSEYRRNCAIRMSIFFVMSLVSWNDATPKKMAAASAAAAMMVLLCPVTIRIYHANIVSKSALLIKPSEFAVALAVETLVSLSIVG